MDAPPPPSRMIRVLALASAAILAGCLGPGGIMGGQDLAIEKEAPVSVRNQDGESYSLRFASLVDGEELDYARGAVSANGTTELSVGVPKLANVVLRLTNTDNGKTAESTLASGSCKAISLQSVIDKGVPSYTEIRCT